MRVAPSTSKVIPQKKKALPLPKPTKAVKRATEKRPAKKAAAKVKKAGSRDNPDQKFLQDDMKPPRIDAIDRQCSAYEAAKERKAAFLADMDGALGRIEELMSDHGIDVYRCGPNEFVIIKGQKLQVKKAKV